MDGICRIVGIVGWLWLASLSCCDDEANRSSSAGTASSTGATLDQTKTASLAEPDRATGDLFAMRKPRRPEQRFFLARSGHRCWVYWQRADERSKPRLVRCPRDLLPGERIRLAGRTCLREGGDEARRVPVRCPGELLTAERLYRRDAGSP